MVGMGMRAIDDVSKTPSLTSCSLCLSSAKSLVLSFICEQQ